MDSLLIELISDGYIKKAGQTKIYLTDDDRKSGVLDCFMIYPII